MCDMKWIESVKENSYVISYWQCLLVSIVVQDPRKKVAAHDPVTVFHADEVGLTEIAALDIEGLNIDGLYNDGLDNGGPDIDGLDIAGLDIDGRLWTIEYNILTQ